jgi:hypothetical protein
VISATIYGKLARFYISFLCFNNVVSWKIRFLKKYSLKNADLLMSSESLYIELLTILNCFFLNSIYTICV